MIGSNEPWISTGIDAAMTIIDPRGDTRWETNVLHGTGGGTLGGSAIVKLHSADVTRVAKIVKRNDAAPDHPLSWRRELDVYESAWLHDRLPAGIVLPRRLGCVVTDDAAVIVMDHVEFDDPDDRSTSWYEKLGYELGRLNGATVKSNDPPTWASQNFLAYEMNDAVEVLPSIVSDPSPVIGDLLAIWQPYLTRLATGAGLMISALDESPRCLSHLDIFSRNAAMFEDRFVLIDWAYAGIAPMGSDAAAVIAITPMFGDMPGDDFVDFSERVTVGYLKGLDEFDVGLSAEQTRLAIDQGVTLRFARFLTQLQGVGDDLPAVVEAVSGRSFEVIRPTLEALAAALEPTAERALGAVRS